MPIELPDNPALMPDTIKPENSVAAVIPDAITTIRSVDAPTDGATSAPRIDVPNTSALRTQFRFECPPSTEMPLESTIFSRYRPVDTRTRVLPAVALARSIPP